MPIQHATFDPMLFRDGTYLVEIDYELLDPRSLRMGAHLALALMPLWRRFVLSSQLLPPRSVAIAPCVLYSLQAPQTFIHTPATGPKNEPAHSGGVFLLAGDDSTVQQNCVA